LYKGRHFLTKDGKPDDYKAKKVSNFRSRVGFSFEKYSILILVSYLRNPGFKFGICDLEV
jgi:hypothetical protein